MDSRLPGELRMLAKRRKLVGMVAVISDGESTRLIAWGRGVKAKDQARHLAAVIRDAIMAGDALPLAEDMDTPEEATDAPAE